MAFWSGEKIFDEFQRLQIVDSFSPNNIDCSAYTLTVGPEYFVSPDYTAHYLEIKKRHLQAPMREDVGGVMKAVPGESFVIPPGQFAYLQTEEIVKIPDFAMGFISLKFGVKGPGLINVSGFHVDPGYHGRLIFSVYNASSSLTRLRRLQPVFLLWMADLDRPSTYKKAPVSEPRNKSISEDMVSRVDQPIHSMQALSDRLERLNEQVGLMQSVAIAIGVLGGILIGIFSLIVTME